MKKPQRRIEITAFRRRVAVIRDVNGSEQAPVKRDDEQWSADASLLPARDIDSPGNFATIDPGGSPELLALVEALFKSDGDSTVAAQELHLSRSSFYSKLRKLGLSITNLKTSLYQHRKRIKGRSLE